MKILMVTNTYLPIVGGLERSIESFTTMLKAWGHEVRIVVPKLDGIEAHGDDVVTIPAFYQFRKTGFPLALPAFASLARLMDAYRPDVIHSHHPFLLGEMAVRLAARSAKPLVYTYHILFDEYFRYLPVPPAVSRRFLVELACGYANLAARVIAPSESVKAIIRNEGVKRPIDVVPTGVDVEKFSKGNGKKARLSLDIPEGAFVLGYAGRLAPEKNPGLLAEAAAAFVRTHAGSHFLVAGKGPSAELIEKTFRDAGIAHRLHMTGAVPQEDLADYYRAMDVFVLASQSETQGLVLCEAMAAGVPAVGIDSPGVREVIRDGVNGRLLRHGTFAELYAALRALPVLGSEEWKRMKEGAIETARHFSSMNCTRRLLQVYEKAVFSENDYGPACRTEWGRGLRRIRSEWRIMSNFGRAAGLALTGTGRLRSPT